MPEVPGRFVCQVTSTAVNLLGVFHKDQVKE